MYKIWRACIYSPFLLSSQPDMFTVMLEFNAQGQKGFVVPMICTIIGTLPVTVRAVCKALAKDGFHLDD